MTTRRVSLLVVLSQMAGVTKPEHETRIFVVRVMTFERLNRPAFGATRWLGETAGAQQGLRFTAGLIALECS